MFVRTVSGSVVRVTKSADSFLTDCSCANLQSRKIDMPAHPSPNANLNSKSLTSSSSSLDTVHSECYVCLLKTTNCCCHCTQRISFVVFLLSCPISYSHLRWATRKFASVFLGYFRSRLYTSTCMSHVWNDTTQSFVHTEADLVVLQSIRWHISYLQLPLWIFIR